MSQNNFLSIILLLQIALLTTTLHIKSTHAVKHTTVWTGDGCNWRCDKLGAVSCGWVVKSCCLKQNCKKGFVRQKCQNNKVLPIDCDGIYPEYQIHAKQEIHKQLNITPQQPRNLTDRIFLIQDIFEEIGNATKPTNVTKQVDKILNITEENPNDTDYKKNLIQKIEDMINNEFKELSQKWKANATQEELRTVQNKLKIKFKSFIDQTFRKEMKPISLKINTKEDSKQSLSSFIINPLNKTINVTIQNDAFNTLKMDTNKSENNSESSRTHTLHQNSSNITSPSNNNNSESLPSKISSLHISNQNKTPEATQQINLQKNNGTLSHNNFTQYKQNITENINNVTLTKNDYSPLQENKGNLFKTETYNNTINATIPESKVEVKRKQNNKRMTQVNQKENSEGTTNTDQNKTTITINKVITINTIITINKTDKINEVKHIDSNDLHSGKLSPTQVNEILVALRDQQKQQQTSSPNKTNNNPISITVSTS